ncbi:MAG: hypothetical protein QNJ62_00885 [Methyloceanibacter sp.]|nr:hypothetical protein [Methyloceanibacter sp.]
MKLTFFALLSLALLAGSAFADEPNKRNKADANNVGMWKSYAPADLRGEFENYDPIGLINGELIRTDCSINYTDPDDKKVYCFNSATALVYFERWPKTYAKRAAEALAIMKKAMPEC